jgi:hypothetical protein
MRRALDLLRAALSTPITTRYLAESTSGKGKVYELLVDSAGDVMCSCPGFEYRGACTHARGLKTALATGGELPPAIRVREEPADSSASPRAVAPPRPSSTERSRRSER